MVDPILSYKFLLTIHQKFTIIMKKVRFFKKDPTKILKALDNPSRSKKKTNKSYLDREKVKSLNLKLYPSEKN